MPEEVDEQIGGSKDFRLLKAKGVASCHDPCEEDLLPRLIPV